MRLTPAQLSTYSGYSRRSSSWGPSLRELRDAGLIVQEQKELLLTDAGLSLVGDVEDPRTPGEIQEVWLRRLPVQSAAFLRIMIKQYPTPITRDELADVSGYSLTSSSFGPSLKVLRDNSLADELAHGWVAADELVG